MKSLGSDTMAPAFPEVIAALANANTGEEAPYGGDTLTARVTQTFSEMFDRDVVVRWAFGGTGANVLAIAPTVKRHEGIVLADLAHMVKHECGAVTQATEAQFHVVSTTNAKMIIEGVRAVVQRAQHPHTSRPAVLSITQATEEGTVYTVDEIRQLVEIAREFDMYVHVDGARLANAVASVDASVKEMLTDTGVDIVSFGATKAGALFGEAVVILEPKLREDIHRVHVASGQLAAKSRFVAAQFEALLKDDLWLHGARNANDTARLLAKQIAEIAGCTVRPGDINMVFVDTTPEISQRISEALGLRPYDIGSNTFRWITAWNTTVEDVNELTDFLRLTLGRG